MENIPTPNQSKKSFVTGPEMYQMGPKQKYQGTAEGIELPEAETDEDFVVESEETKPQWRQGMEKQTFGQASGDEPEKVEEMEVKDKLEDVVEEESVVSRMKDNAINLIEEKQAEMLAWDDEKFENFIAFCQRQSQKKPAEKQYYEELRDKALQLMRSDQRKF